MRSSYDPYKRKRFNPYIRIIRIITISLLFITTVSVIWYKLACLHAYKDLDNTVESSDSSSKEETISEIGKILQGSHKTKSFHSDGKNFYVVWQLNDSSWGISEFPINMIRLEFKSIDIPEIRFRWVPNNNYNKLSENLQKDLNKYVKYIVLVVSEEDWNASGFK